MFGVQNLTFTSDLAQKFFLFFFSIFASLSFLLLKQGQSYYPARRRYYYDIFLGAGCSNNPCGTNAVCREASGGRPGMILSLVWFCVRKMNVFDNL